MYKLLLVTILKTSMSLYELSQYLLVTHTIALLVIGIIFVTLGYKGSRNLKKIKLGWIFIGISSILATFLLVWFGSRIGYWSLLGFLLLLAPFVIVGFLIATLVLGISSLVGGYSQPKDKAMIKKGWTFLIINMAAVTTIIVLLLMFMSGLIPIRLM